MNIGDRMKRYERVSETHLMCRTPTIIRIDGKAFHTWTKKLQKPFDENLLLWMAHTTRFLVDNIQNAVFAYTQSDEISILLRDYDNHNTDQWFDANVQKMCSVSASLATAKFNDLVNSHGEPYDTMPLAFFDSRAFNVPENEVCNYFIWRQQDCIRNSISALATHVMGHKECQGVNCTDLQEKMESEHDIAWSDLPMYVKHGITYDKRSKDITFNVPEFTQLREFVEVHVRNV